MRKKIISAFLALSMLTPFAAHFVAYGEDQTGGNITISATGGDDTVQINAAAELPDKSETTGRISLSYDSSQVVEKDYMQKVIINAENISDNTESFYLRCDNQYEDIYMNFVLSGSEDAPITLVGGETRGIELSVFAQNARNTVYDIPVRAYNTDGTFLASVTIRIKCNAVISPIEFETIGTNENTLVTEYEVTNVSDRKIPDMTLLLDGAAANYAKISPIVENCELDAGKKIKVKVIPDLSKIKTDGLTSIDGKIKAAGGAAGETGFTVDVEGKHITSSYAGNLQIGWDYDEATGTLVITGGGAIPDFEDGLVPWSKYTHSAKRIVIGNYVESIGSYSFKDFNAVETIYLPKSLCSIGDFAFSGCDSLKEINFVGTEEDWEKIEKPQGWNTGAEDAALLCGIYNYYQLNDISVTDNTVSVNMTNITSASVLVEIFDEESGELCAYGEQSAAPMTASVDVALETGTVPEYFVVKVTMLDKNRKLMCEALENKHHTKKFVDFFAKKASDFEQEKVVNLDEQQDMNFFVASDDVTVIDTDGTVNVVSAGESENTYTISNATEDVLSLSPGDKVVIKAATAADSFAAKIKEINATDTAAEITADDNISVSEFFKFAKLEMAQTDAPSEMMSVAAGDKIEESTKFEYTIPEDGGAKASVKFSLDISVTVSFYYDPELLGDDYLELDTSVTLKPQITAKCEDEYKWNYDYALGPGFDIVSQVGIGLSIQPSAVVHLEAMAKLIATAHGTCTVGYNYTSTTGGKAYGELNGGFELETEAKLMVQAGIAIHIAITFLREINIASISPEFGVQADGTTSYTYTTEQEDCIHDCFICIDGNADLYASADVVVLPIGDKPLWKKEDIYKYKHDIGDFYISEPKLGDPFKFDWGDCNNMAYRLDVYVTDKSNGNSPVPGESVAISGSGTGGEHSGPETLVTDSNGHCSTYRSSGSFTASCRDKVKSFSMGDKVKTVKIVLGEPDPPEDGKENVPGGGSADYNTTEGRQCTNAGQTSTNLYIGENDIDDIEKIYETGRMYDGRPYGGDQNYAEDRFGGDKYIHHDNNVDTVYRVNGNNINVPSSSGLTDVYITDLSGAIPYLKPGQNTIVRDYDTDAGHYDVVANREITIIYSNNKQVSYVETPDSEETRLLPDFAVYPETVYLENTAIINEENKGTTKIYNRGSLGGWVDVTITDGVNELYSETNKYMPEFSMAEINFAYTPQSENSSIFVTLENKGLLNEDKDESNNTAEHKVTARERMIPVIDGIAPENIRIDADALSKGTEIIADISSSKDVESVSFKINGIECNPGNVSLTQSENDKIRASVSISDITEGSNEVTVLVNYYAGQTVKTIETTKTVNVSLIDPIRFTTDDTVVNPTFRIYKNGKEMDKQIKSSAEGYIINPTAEMEKQPDQYKLIMTCDGSIAAVKLSELGGSVISLKDGKKLSILTDDNISIRDLNILTIDDMSVSMYPDLSETNELTIAGVDSMNIRLYYDIATGGIDKANVNLSQDVDFTSGNCVIDLAKSYATYELQINDEINNGYDTMVYYTTSEYTDNIYPHVSYDANTKKMFVTIGGDRYSRLSDAQSVVLRVSFDNTVYIEDLKEYSGAVVLDKSNNNKISFTCDAENTRVSNVEFYDGKYYSNFNLADGVNEIYMPDGEYEIYVSYTVGEAYATHRQKIKLSGSDVTVKLPVKVFDMGEISAEWPQAFDKASLRYIVFDSEGSEFSGSHDNIAQSQAVQVPVGEQMVSINCVMTDENGYERALLSMYKNIDVKKGKPLSISFGGNLTADLKIYGERYSAGDKMTVNLSNIVDENGARLEQYDAYRNELGLTGYLVLTNKTNSAKTYRIPVSTNYMYDGKGIGVAIPYTVEAGEYLYSMELSNNGELSDNLGISATAGSGGSISPSGFIAANPGESIAFTISPDSGYTINDVLVDGVSVGKVNQYKFENITQSHTILAQFRRTSTNRGGGGGGVSSYTVRFESNGGSNITNVTVDRNNTVFQPEVPIREGYVFDGWYTDAELTKKYDFSAKVTKSFTLYAKWTEKKAGINPGEWKNPFKDVKEGDWFYKTVQAVNEQGLMLGVSDDIFAPNDSITRAMFVTILHRLEDEPQTGTNSFTDVESGAYYEKAVAWAASGGIVNGVTDTEFEPDGNITREQIAAMIFRYARYKGIDTASSDVTGNFTDADKISDYALPAIGWVVNKEIMNGKGNGVLDPLGNATRAEAAAMLVRLANTM